MFESWIRIWSLWLNYHLSMTISTQMMAQAYKVWISTMACSCWAPGMEIWLMVQISRFVLYYRLVWTCHPVGASILLVMCMFQMLIMFWCTLDKDTQPEYAGSDMIHMPQVYIAQLGIINSQFYRFLRLSSSKVVFFSQMVSFIILLNSSCYSLKVLSN